MNLLVLGGTIFLGRHIVEAALARGHAVTLLNRGRHGATLFPEVERLVGDRDGDLSALEGRTFDATIDCSGYTPAQVERIATALGERAGHVVFVSSISAYARFEPGVMYDEASPLAKGHEGYGALKARAEQVVRSAWPETAAIVRPGLIVGPHDPTGRFTYWPQRVARGGEILAPGRPRRHVQFIDARDLAQWLLALAESRIDGSFNATGPRLAMLDLLESCRELADSDARFAWVDDETLLAERVTPWTELPLWLPESDPEFGGMMNADLTRAHEHGLRHRSLAETVADTLAWTPDADDLAAARAVTTLSPEREAQILASARP